VIGVGETQLDYLTREPVEGELLASRIATIGFSPEEALQFGIDLGTVLNRAHSRAMVHGSLSPYTVVFTADGLHILAPHAIPDPRCNPYRAPEQVRGEKPDWRSDIFAFGAILYEVATGQAAFRGEGIALDQAILHEIPSALGEPSAANAAMEGVISGCLEKDPTARRQRIQNAVIELKFAGRGMRRATADPQALVPARLTPEVEMGHQPRADEAPHQPPPRHYPRPSYVVENRPPMEFTFGMRFWAVLGGVLLLAVAAIAAVLLIHRRPAEPVLRFALSPPENTSYPSNPVVSPDGKNLTLSAVGPDGQRMLWLRPLDALRPMPIPGTEGGSAPFWSPDSQFIGFFAGHDLKKVQIDKWVVSRICDADANPGGGAWNNDGSVLFAPNLSDGLFRALSVGGKREQLLKPRPEKGEYSFLWPQFLPDGKHFLFFVLTGSQDTTGIYAGSLDSREYTRVLSTATNGLYAATGESDSRKHGYLLFMRDRNLMGQSFNAAKLTLQGEAVTLAEDIGAIASLSLAPISVSNNSILVYQEVGRSTRQMVWMDRSGKFTGVAPEPAEWGPPRISPDGKRGVAARRTANAEVEQADLMFIQTNGNTQPFTETPMVHEVNPVWSPDGQKIAFSEAPPRLVKGGLPENSEFNYDIFVKTVDGARPELLYKSPVKKNPTDWSRDGRWLIFDNESKGTGHDIWAYSFAEHRAGPVVETVSEEHFGALSPNGRWLAYQSDENGHTEVYVQSFDGLVSGTKRRFQVSQNGGGMPRWRGDGMELFFLTASGRMMSAVVHATESSFEFEPPQALFQTRPIPKTWNWFDVSSDGQRFLCNLPHEFSNASKINVVSNWPEKLKD